MNIYKILYWLLPLVAVSGYLCNANIIFIIHLLLFTVSLILPFSDNKLHLLLFSICVPFVFWHWSINDDTCSLTQFEMYLTGVPKHEAFFGRLLGPIFKVSNRTSDVMLKTLYLFLFLIAQFKLFFKAVLKKNLILKNFWKNWQHSA